MITNYVQFCAPAAAISMNRESVIYYTGGSPIPPSGLFQARHAVVPQGVHVADGVALAQPTQWNEPAPVVSAHNGQPLCVQRGLHQAGKARLKIVGAPVEAGPPRLGHRDLLHPQDLGSI